MLGPLAVVVPIVMAAVLVASGVAKLRHPDDLAGWAEIGVPKVLRRQWLVRLHPWGELALGLVLLVAGGIIGLIAALGAVALMAAYLWLVWRAVARVEDASCACFGTRQRVTGVTVARNRWLTALAVLAAAVIWTNPPLGGALAAAFSLSGWGWLLGLGIAVVTVLFVMWPDPAPVGSPATQTVDAGPADDEELDYIRTRTPAVPVTLADGSLVNLRRLTMQRPLLLLAVSETCGGCEPVIERLEEWRALLPEIDVRFLLAHAPEQGSLTRREEPQSLHDPYGYVSGSIEDWPTPTAVLFGIDGLLAGGPVVGFVKIEEFVSDIHDSLRAVSVER